MARTAKSQLSRFGFRPGAGGAHTARTIMLAELTALLASVPGPEAGRAEYARAIVDENCLGKRSGKTRSLSLKHLVELYSLDPGELVFRALLYYWERDPEGRPLLALLCAVTRDSLLRESAAKILKNPEGALFTTADMEAFLEHKHPGRFSAATLTSTAQNLNASWVKSGHLRGVMRKLRVRPKATAGAAAGAAAAVGAAAGAAAVGASSLPARTAATSAGCTS